MEKRPDEAEPQLGQASYQRRRSPRKWLVVVVVTLGLVLLSRSRDIKGTWFPLKHDVQATKPSTVVRDSDFNWDSIPSKTSLEYTDCYDGFQCARLDLPMDYWNGTTDARVSIAIIKKPAAVPVTHPQYGGPIISNPGGPGGSGVSFLLKAANATRRTVDEPDGKYYDLISFDPRGVANSRPLMYCFEDPGLEWAFHLRAMEEGVYSASDAAFGRLWSMSKAHSAGCSLPRDESRGDIRKYISTPYVARDMLGIVERHGEWREKEAKRLLREGGHCGGGAMRKMTVDEEILDVLKYKPGEEQLQYWGFSYGSFLGNTFAAMFPDRIFRLIVDGIVDAYDYSEALWLDALLDTEKDLALFYHHCARVGYPSCAIANSTGTTSPADVRARFDAVAQSLYHNPLPVVATEPDVITYSDLKTVVFIALYSPLQAFPYLANVLAELERGEGTLMSLFLRPFHTYTCPVSRSAMSATSPAPLMGIACTDAYPLHDISKEAFRKHVNASATLSPAVGELVAAIRLSCIHYTVRAVYRFPGPWEGDTSHPILEIGNTADPVTPGRFAKKMAKGFKGAVALLQDSAGHCSISTPSRCTEEYIRRYFQTGELPEKDTVCPADEMPFGNGEEEVDLVMDLERAERRERVRNMAQALWEANRGGGFGMHGLGLF